MPFNESIRYVNNRLQVDDVAVSAIVGMAHTPTYIYSLRRILSNYDALRRAFHGIDLHIHYSAKANANLTILNTLIKAGAGIDAVSGGEIYRALQAGANPQEIVFAGVGKTPEEIRYALEQGIGWFNVENLEEFHIIEHLAEGLGRSHIRVAPRLNPEVTANTHPYIATGHGGAKFGLTAEAIGYILSHQSAYRNLSFEGLHLHIGSQLHDTHATQQAINKALGLIMPYPQIKTLNIGGGLPVAYGDHETLPSPEAFAAPLRPLLAGYKVLLEPGRFIVADAGILVGRILYRKKQGGQTVLITDMSMTELIRPALYEAVHQIIPVERHPMIPMTAQIAGPVCETSDMLGKDVMLDESIKVGELLAILTTGAYGMVMASNYNARPRPMEVAVAPDGQTWSIIRQRETWEDLLRTEPRPHQENRP